MTIEFSKRDIEKGLVLPDKITEDLAYFCGILAGDGCLYSRPKKDYMINCGGNPHNEREFYNSVLKPLIKRIFNLDIIMKLIGNKSTYGFVIYSKSLFTFLSENIGLPTGKKYPNLRIPIVFNTILLKTYFLRGMADTDFCLSLKKTNKNIPHYPVVSTASKSKSFLLELNDVLLELGFKPSLSLNCTYFDKRYQKVYTIHRMDIVGHKNIKLWMEKVGFKNPKYLERYHRYKQIYSKRF